ncbi:hypothetical protein D5086_007450 [Populus alba]|uniref:Uncharacterized protein n=1 Tax=Populus alba TaxID=43335 RepID=A0ACC4CPX5_POPAL
MGKTSKQGLKNSANTSINPTTKVKRTRKSVPRDSPTQRSSIYRGVTRHRWTGRYEAHLWDKNCWNESQNKKGRQGAYDDEEAAGHAYDLAALKYWGQDTILNFPKLELDFKSHQQSSSVNDTELVAPTRPCGAGGSASSALGLLLQSSKFKEMLERTSASECPLTPPESDRDPPRRSFPDDIQTYFDCQDSSSYTDGDDIIFGDLHSFASPIFHCELDG